MAWQDPRTWTVGQVVTAAEMNQDIRDNETELAKHAVEFVLDEGGGVLSTDTPTGYHFGIYLPFRCTVDAARIFAKEVGDITVDLRRSTSASDSFPPADTDSITSSDPITLACDQVGLDTTLAGWTVNLEEDDFIAAAIEACVAITNATVVLEISNR